jgi:MFS transporter, DHA1 family, multidrug resistance protein B
VEKMNDRYVLLSTCFVFVMGYGIISYSTNLWVLFIVMFFATAGEVLRVCSTKLSKNSVKPLSSDMGI